MAITRKVVKITVQVYATLHSDVPHYDLYEQNIHSKETADKLFQGIAIPEELEGIVEPIELGDIFVTKVVAQAIEAE